MRRSSWVCMCVAVAACSSEPTDTGFVHVAVRAIDGPWVASDCLDTSLIPVDKPYEVAIISGRDDTVVVTVVRAGPGDRPSLAAPGCTTEEIERVDVEVEVLGVSSARVGLAGTGGDVWDGMWTIPNALPRAQDIIVIPYDYTGGLGKYILVRGADLTQRRIVLDATSDAKPLERRDLTVTGLSSPHDSLVQLRTASGTYADIWPEFPRPDYGATTISTVPASDLVEGDEQVLWVLNASVWVNLGAIPSGPITVAAPPPIDDASCVLTGPALALDASTSLAWNEYLIDVYEPSRVRTRRLAMWKYKGWPEPGFGVPDLGAIPGWQPEWAVEHRQYGTDMTSCRFYLCDDNAQQRSCSDRVVQASTL